jgi:hypothetical protein
MDSHSVKLDFIQNSPHKLILLLPKEGSSSFQVSKYEIPVVKVVNVH